MGFFFDIDHFPYRHGTSDDVSDGVWRDFFPTLIVSPTDIERLTTYGGVWWIFSDIDRFTYRHGTSDDVWRRMVDFFRH